MSATIYFIDFDKKSREPDAVAPRNPTDATIIILPVIRRLNAPLPSVFLPESDFPFPFGSYP